jgi:multidrug resistance efflux pump
MSFWARLKFFFGILVVFTLVGLLVLYLNNAMSSVHAARAELGADTTTLGVDFPGHMTKQNVTEGDTVRKGQTLFVINSPQLVQAITEKSLQPSILPFSTDPQTHDILIKATDDGAVEKLHYRNGSYIPGGAVVATMDTADTLFISGHFHLSPPDYARVKKGSAMTVTFPDNGHAKATVYSITLAQTGDSVDTVVKARLQNATVGDFRFPVGTPVEASLQLTQRTWYQDVTDFVHKLFKPSAE